MYRKKREQGPIYTDVDQLPLQTLQIYKPKVEKPNPDVVIQGIAIELEHVRKDFGISVASKRQVRFEKDDEEEEMSIKEKEAEDERLKKFFTDTRSLIDQEIKFYKKAFDSSVKDFSHKDEYKKEDQEALRKSDDILEKKIARINRLEVIRDSLDKEIKAMVKEHEKSEKEADLRLKTTAEKYQKVIKYLERELQRTTANDTTLDLFRTLEKNLRDTVNKYENIKAREEILSEELKKVKKELHEFKNKSYEESLAIARSASRIKCIEKELYTAEERAESAERSLCRMAIRQRTPQLHH
ncbi:hypothetical protein PVAND_008404 [Polypedilum vanderplanki]|uniref:Uncharacterized protein n=1 Tax=Polypedilum vanderplanki TaxID=319348 RepID=A0A9J6CA38_POLVA|nr:hypothetical protein PVAND_008404 [Polypedilum vanderplanki]